MKPLTSTIFSLQEEGLFQQKALELFHYQARHNNVYARYLQNLGIQPGHVRELNQIPFLPIEFFKYHQVLTGEGEIQEIFTSSGTTGMAQSKHYVRDVKIYEESYLRAFERFYGPVENYCILALLPSYLEREGSSLIYMAADLIRRSKHSDSGFYLHNYDELLNKLQQLKKKKQQTLLLGVTYSLVDIAALYSKSGLPPLQHTIIMETGGMKGKRREMIREELHGLLCGGFGVNSVHSEYGMTELLSQAYSKDMGRFACPPWMRILIRDARDPFTFLSHRQTGGINIIDLANVNSCAFIASQDLGKTVEDGSFEILGRFDASDIRGCNLLV